MESVKVTVVEFSDRKCYQLQWRDPLSGRKKTKTSGIERPPFNAGKRVKAEAEKQAWKAAADHEKLLLESGGCLPRNITWQDFRARYEREYLASLAEATFSKVCGAFLKVEAYIKPAKLADVTAARLSHMQAEMRTCGLAESTIKGILAHLHAALGWAKEQGLIRSVPVIKMPKRAKASKSMKGRPIAAEEFERMLAAVPKVLGAGIVRDIKRTSKQLADSPTDAELAARLEQLRDDFAELASSDRAESWRHYLLGLWLSGLRLEESLNLYWDRRDRLCIELDGKRPLLWIPGDMHKSGVDTLAPVAPEFAQFLLATPEAQRVGRVFKPAPERKHGDRMTKDRVSRIVSRIGEVAGVKVDERTKADADGKPAVKVKYASAHDLRRSFGERWATRVMPQVLQELMRHENIETTLKYYVGRNAQRTADVLWQAHEAHEAATGNKSSNIAQEPAPLETRTLGT